MSWLSSLLGLDAQHSAGVAQQKADNYSTQAAGAYGNIGAQGQQQTGVYNGNYLSLLNRYGGFAGLGGESVQGPNTGTPAVIPGIPGQEGQGNGSPANNPYNLDVHEQERLNQTTANIAKQSQHAMASYQQQLTNRGITDPRALQVGQEQIQEHFAALNAEAQTSFYEQIKQDKMKALQSLIGEIGQYGAQGISEQEAAAGGYGSLAGAQQNQSNIQTQNAQAQQAGFLHLLTQFAPGGTFNSGGAGGGGVPFAIDSQNQVA